MNEQAPGGAPAAVTPRLVFDANRASALEADVPAFLLKERGIKPSTELTEAEQPIVIQEPTAPLAFSEPVADELETVEAPDAVEAPAANEGETEEVLALEDEHSDDDAGESHDGSANLDEMSVEDLQRQQADIDRRIQEKREAEKRSVIEQIVNVVNTYKIPVEELVEALGGLKIKRKGVKATPKYIDPATGTIWSGRGKEPAWIKGKDRKPFLIK